MTTSVKETKKAKHEREVKERLSAKEAQKAKMYAFVKSHPVGAAVEPLLKDAVASAEKDAREFIEKAIPQLEAAGWDLEVLAPYPSGSLSCQEYRKALEKRNFFGMITKQTNPEACRRPHSPDPRELSAEGVARFIQYDKDAAAFNYEAFQFKLVHKIGACKSAVLDGNHVWSHSILVVTKDDGSIERWKTQQIMNRSVYGKLFNQYPSRRVK